MIYIAILLYALFLYFRYNISRKKSGEKINFYFLLCLVSAVVGFSYRLGMDTIGYSDYFYGLDSFPVVVKQLHSYRYEPAFMLLLSICKSICDDFAFVQIVIAFFVNTVVFYFFRRNTKYYYFAIFVYFLFQFWNFNFEIKRESISVSFFLLGVNYILKSVPSKKDYVYYYIFAFLCFCFHHFGFIVFFFPLLTKIKINTKLIIMLSAVFVVFLLGESFLKSLLWSVNTITTLYFNASVSNYLDSRIYGVANFYTFSGVLFALFVPIIILYKVKDIMNKKILSLAVIVFFVSMMSTQVFIFYRLYNYFCFFLFLVFAEFAGVFCSTKNSKVSSKLLLIALIAVTFYGKLHKESYIRYYPYSSVFTKEICRDRESEFYRLSKEFQYQ